MKIEDLRQKYEEKFGTPVSNRYKNNVEWIEGKIECDEKCEAKPQVTPTVKKNDVFTLVGADGKKKTDSKGNVRQFMIRNGKTIELCQ